MRLIMRRGQLPLCGLAHGALLLTCKLQLDTGKPTSNQHVNDVYGCDSALRYSILHLADIEISLKER